MKTSKPFVAVLAASALFGALALAQGGCTSHDTSTPTGCVAAYADAGSGYACAVEWSCSRSETYEIECTLAPDDPGNYACTCRTNTESAQTTVTLNRPTCDLVGGAAEVASACGYTLQM